MILNSAETEELARLEAAFEEAGGRGVEIAERIDFLRNKRELLTNLIDNLTVEHYTVLIEALGDAYAYRIGEACDLDDEDLDEHDRDVLVKMHALADALGVGIPS